MHLRNSKNMSSKIETYIPIILTSKINTLKISILSEKWTLQCWPHLMSQSLKKMVLDIFFLVDLEDKFKNFEGSYFVDSQHIK
jgi:hypothetical protein